jgi:dipeptidyl aminopeptidase/acylaminoacyl peptidase
MDFGSSGFLQVPHPARRHRLDAFETLWDHASVQPEAEERSMLRLLFLTATASILVLTLAACSEEEARAGIAFQSNRDKNLEIYVMNADGSSQTNLTNNPAGDTEPAWSPDGSKIAFASDRSDNWEIYVMNADGTAQTNLTNNSAPDYDPAWSP